MLVPALAALAAAACFAVATALQHRSAGLVSGSGSGRALGLAAFVAKTLRHPLWALGLLADTAGLVLHALALKNGPLTVVQPLLVAGVVFALPLRRLLEHRPPGRTEIAWATVLTLGLALFFAVATPANGTSQPADVLPVIVSALLIGTAVLGCFIAGRYSSGSKAAVLLGAAAALAFAAAAGLLKEVMTLLARGVSVLLTDWPLYALVGVGAIALVLNQLAYQAGPLSVSLPIMTTLNPVVSLVIGIAVFDEHFRNAPMDLLGEGVALALIVAAAVSLTRSESVLPHGKAKGAKEVSSDDLRHEDGPNHVKFAVAGHGGPSEGPRGARVA
jgi:multidrug transporter EmrE-like cation transporter